MDLIISNLRIPIEQDGLAAYTRAASEILKISPSAVALVKILSKSLDATLADQFYYRLSIAVNVPDHVDNPAGFPLYSASPERLRITKTTPLRPVIIGFGPAGMFAALELLDCGLMPLIFERGKKLEDRDLDVQKFIKERTLNPESNIQFGEGGAGSYSDGKLFSRINNSDHANRVLDTLIRFGAPDEIGYISKPHLGTDVLCRIVRNIRNHILEQGGEIHYSAKLTDLKVEDGAVSRIVINGGQEYPVSHLYLAIGHSARDTFAMLHEKGIALEQKPISVGVRIEHPAETINRIRYGEKYQNYPSLGAATYSFNHTNRVIGRGVYTFCMCPGGEIVNASPESGCLVLNGMSYSRRASAFSNSALVVSCHTSDYSSSHPLAGFDFQRAIERKAFESTGRGWKAPAQNLVDFLDGRLSTVLNPNSCKMGTVPVALNELFPDFVSEALLSAFAHWRDAYPLFVSEHAVLLAPETRTSSPVRIKRNERFESVNVKNLFPIGEGSGYTGGITSSAIDAIKAVEFTTQRCSAGGSGSAG